MTGDPIRAIAEAGALRTALVLAAKTGWRFDPGPLLPSSFAAYLHVDRARLLIVPTSAGLDFAARQVDPITRSTRSDALIVSRPTDAMPSFGFATWTLPQTVWSWPLVLWLSTNGIAWLVPTYPADGDVAIELANAVHRRIALPWSNEVERFAGFGRASDWLARVAAVIRNGSENRR